MNAQRRSLSNSAADLAHKTSNSSTSLQAEGGLGFTFDKTLRARQVRDNRTDGQMWLAEFCQRAGRYDDMLKIMEDVINSQEPGLPLFKGSLHPTTEVEYQPRRRPNTKLVFDLRRGMQATGCHLERKQPPCHFLTLFLPAGCGPDLD